MRVDLHNCLLYKSYLEARNTGPCIFFFTDHNKEQNKEHNNANHMDNQNHTSACTGCAENNNKTSPLEDACRLQTPLVLYD